MSTFSNLSQAAPNSPHQSNSKAFSRNILDGKKCRIIPKNDLKKSDLPSTLHICVNLRNWPLTKSCKISNLPINMEKYLMQSYHFKFTHGDLEKMVTTPKVAFDRYHKNFVSNGELVSKSFFSLIAPQVEGMNLPIVYRFSISRYVDDPQHYSISMHAIVGGREDGWLFLARLDNNNKNEHIVKEGVKAMVKTHYDVIDQIKPCPAENLAEKGKFHIIPYPHMHRADSNYEKGIQPEKLVPIYIEKCKNNTFEQNIEYMMNLFNIQNHTMFCLEDEYVDDVVFQSKKFIIPEEKVKTAVDFTSAIESMEKMHGREVGDIDAEEILAHFKNKHQHHSTTPHKHRHDRSGKHKKPSSKSQNSKQKPHNNAQSAGKKPQSGKANSGKKSTNGKPRTQSR